MLFGAGTIPTYIVYTQYYHLGDSLLVYMLPCICGGAGTTFMLRAYMKGLSESLYELCCPCPCPWSRRCPS